MQRFLVIVLALAALGAAAPAPAPNAAPGTMQLPAFPLPEFVRDGDRPREVNTVRLLRDLQRGGIHGYENFETADADYALLQGASLALLGAWLEEACRSVDFNIQEARQRNYDGSIFVRLLATATSLAALREKGISLAMPIGVLLCQRTAAWGDLPADGASDAYVLIATNDGMVVYDPPTRQLAKLADFPNKAKTARVRF